MFLTRSAVNLLLLLVIVSTPRPAAGAADASNVVKGFQAALIEVMKESESLGMKGRVEKLSRPVDTAFRLPFIARIAIGDYWNKAGATQRQHYADAFRAMSLSTMATYFDGYSGERFVIGGEQAGPQNTRIVLTHIIKSDKSEIAIDYVMLKFEEGWRIIDVILDKGISELSVRRSEYSLVLRQQGLDGLIRLLESKAKELMAQ